MTENIASLVLDWNRADLGTDVPYESPGPSETVATVFESLARRQPGKTAVVTERPENPELTYADVDERAGNICNALRSLGIGRGGTSSERETGSTYSCVQGDDIVLVALPRSTALPVALLGVVKSGSAYWGVDLSQQSPGFVRRSMQRLNCRAVIVDEASQRMLFSAQEEGSSATGAAGASLVLPSGVGVVLVQWDGAVKTVTPAIGSLSEQSPFVCPALTMYVEFTSGSTGEPKAVAVPHSACLAFVKNSASVYFWSSCTRSLLYHSVSFDLHAHDLWGPWAHGGAVVVVDVLIADVNGVWARGRNTNVTHLSMTPFGFAMFTMIHFRLRRGDDYSALRCIMLCGEALDLRTLEPWKSSPATSSVDIINSYGITETTIVNTFLHVTSEQTVGGWPSSIGRRLPHTLMLLLDDNCAPVRHGERGQIFLAGDCLASGYITSASKTDTSFVPIPEKLQSLLMVVCPSMNARLMYKTGDIGHYDERHGGFVFGGRVDNEIKSGGYRIHPLEVEQAMAKLACIDEAVVVAGKHPDSRNVLFAFVVLKAEFADKVTKSTIRQELRSHVADYKLPTIQIVESGNFFPKTASHKVDRVTLSTMATEALSGRSTALS
jgi:acyl-coenzyme A synthetase/AMP-(fatty) acid ligase